MAGLDSECAWYHVVIGIQGAIVSGLRPIAGWISTHAVAGAQRARLLDQYLRQVMRLRLKS